MKLGWGNLGVLSCATVLCYESALHSNLPLQRATSRRMLWCLLHLPSRAICRYWPNNTPAKFYPKGPFGGYEAVGTKNTGVVGDNSKSVQINAFEKGEDYLFFQGPAPKTAVQEDLPSFFSLDNLAGAEIKPMQIVVTGTGLGSLGALGFLLFQGA